MAEPLHYSDETLLQYLDGEMNQPEKDLLVNQLQTDAVLKERLQKMQLAILTVRQYGNVQKVKSIHKEIVQEFSTSKKQAKVVSIKTIVRYTLAAAASIIILLVGINLFSTGKSTSVQLYNEAFVEYQVSGVRGSEQLSPVENLYQAKKYDAVISDSKKLSSLSEQDSLLIGLSYLKVNDPASAIDWLKLSKQNNYLQDAEFYLALSYLKNKNYDEALKLMEHIRSEQNHVYHNQFTAEYINKVKRLRSNN